MIPSSTARRVVHSVAFPHRSARDPSALRYISLTRPPHDRSRSTSPSAPIPVPRAQMRLHRSAAVSPGRLRCVASTMTKSLPDPLILKNVVQPEACVPGLRGQMVPRDAHQRSRQTIQTASRTIALDILLVPSVRSTKTIGISTIRKPASRPGSSSRSGTRSRWSARASRSIASSTVRRKHLKPPVAVADRQPVTTRA